MRPDTGPSDSGPARQKAGLRFARCHRQKGRLRLADLSGRTGFRPGSCETAGTQGFGSWTCQAEPEGFGLFDPAGRGTGGFGRRNRQGRKRSFGFNLRQAANRRGFGPGRGARGETGTGFGPGWTPEEARPGLRSWFERLETARRECLAFPAWFEAKGQWGPAAMSAPITVLGPAVPRLCRPSPRAAPEFAHRSFVPSVPAGFVRRESAPVHGTAVDSGDDSPR